MKCKINKKGEATISGIHYPNLYTILTLAENRAYNQQQKEAIDSSGYKEYGEMIADIIEVRKVLDDCVKIHRANNRRNSQASL